jgi:glycosyltransferase involved in cell wall biosynthesis
MTDPRFYTWLWEMENEIRSLVPMVYYHVWDNYPYPEFNNVWYNSNDAIVTISKLTSDIVRKVSPKVREKYIPHSVPEELFQTKSDTFRKNFRKSNFNINEEDDHIMFFWNNRNARRKQSGSLIYWFKKFLDQLYDKHENAKATLIMHTAANDPNGQDLHAIINSLGLNQDGKREVLISESKMEPDVLANLYSAVDCTINISDAEGFGLATFESLACGTPIITTMTGGLQEQVTKLNKVTHDDMLKRNSNNPGFTVYEHGIGLEPSSKAIIGSQQVPYIYEDRLCEKQFVDSMMTMYELGNEKRREMGQAGAEHIVENYNFQKNSEKWIEFIENIHDECGSWENRKKYKNWELREIL